MTTKRPSLTPPTLARRRWVRALRIVAVSSVASAAMACSLLFPFDDLSPPRASDGTAADAEDVPLILLPLPDGGLAGIDATLADAPERDASVPEATTCTGCATGFCTSPPTCDYAVFVTKNKTSGFIPPSGGGPSADAFCASEASANEIPGTFRAWVTDGTSASQRVKPTGPSRPYRRLDGVVVALEHAELTSGYLRAAIDIASDRTRIDYYAWTGSNAAGDLLPGYNCANLYTGFANTNASGVVGKTTASNPEWTYAATVSCRTVTHLYCFQVEP